MCSNHSSTSARNAPSAPPSSRSVPRAALGCAGEVVGEVVGVDGGCRYGDADEAADASDGTGEVERRRRCSGGVGMARVVVADMNVAVCWSQAGCRRFIGGRGRGRRDDGCWADQQKTRVC